MAIPVVSGPLAARDPAQDDRHGSGLPEHPAQGVGIVALVGQDVADAARAGQETRCDGDVGDVCRA